MKRNTQAAVHMLPGQPVGYEEIDRHGPSDLTTGVLWIVIPYTTPDLTRAAMRHAAICVDLDVRVALVDIQVIPFPCPFDQPPINKEFSERRLNELLKESGLPGRVSVLHTRDWFDAFEKVLEPGSLVILATKKRWWPTREQKLARNLVKAGHQVMVVPVR